MNISADQLKAKESGVISQINDESFIGRFLALGIEPGASLKIEKIAFFNGARIVKIDGHKFALRKAELEIILLK